MWSQRKVYFVSYHQEGGVARGSCAGSGDVKQWVPTGVEPQRQGLEGTLGTLREEGPAVVHGVVDQAVELRAVDLGPFAVKQETAVCELVQYDYRVFFFLVCHHWDLENYELDRQLSMEDSTLFFTQI